MRLTLTIVNQQTPVAGLELAKTLDGRGVTIGRGPDNDWVLPDPNRHLSKRHCEIAFRDGRYIVVDTSTNGLYLNQSGEPLGRGNQRPLQDGDSLTLGEYRIEVRIAAPAAEATLFSSSDPFAAILAAEPPTDDLDPFGIDREAGANRTFFGAEPRPAPTPNRSDDPLLEAWPDPGAADPSPPLLPDDDALFGDLPQHDRAPVSQPDHVPSEQAYFRPPAVTSPAVVTNEIPEDWDKEDDLDGPPLGAATPVPEQRPAPAPAAPARSDPPQASPETPPCAAGPVDSSALRAFLAGAGLESLQVPEEHAAAVMRAAGETFREMVQGLRDVLMARSTIKNEFRLEATMIRAAGNNPLKFSVSVEDALVAMIRQAGPGYLPPSAAVQEGFKDIKAHQLASMAGMQVALAALLKSFDPEGLKQRLEKGSVLDSILPGARKAKYWELYEKFYQQIAAEAEEDFHGLFGRAFARAYEEQVKKL